MAQFIQFIHQMNQKMLVEIFYKEDAMAHGLNGSAAKFPSPVALDFIVWKSFTEYETNGVGKNI